MISAQEKTHTDVKEPEPSGRPIAFPRCPGPGDRSQMVQLSDVRSQEKPGQVSGDRLHFPSTTRNPGVTQPAALALSEYYWMSKREQQKASSSSGRNESQTLQARASGDRHCSPR